MAEYSISSANLRHIENALGQINANQVEVANRVESVQVQQLEMDTRLQSLIQTVEAFIEADRRAKEVQLAETRLVKVRQELERNYGHYANVRRRATGILQAVDARLVTHETIRGTTEDVMMSSPRYWLAPALVALAAWSRDDEQLAKRALAEAFSRAPDKTALFFALVLRRLGRWETTANWLAHFFQRQDPSQLRREFVVIIDAVATGAFGGPARAMTSEQIAAWLEDLEAQGNFAETQRDRWKGALVALTPVVEDTDFPYLAGHSPTWPQLKVNLAAVERNKVVRMHFENLFSGELRTPESIERQVDDLLDRLVGEFDAEELPLRRQESELDAIVSSGGDREVAALIAEAAEEALRERVDFPTLLTNAAMRPEESGASRGTQRLAVALSRDWIVAAHDALTAATRQASPARIELDIGDWNGQIEDGTDADALVGDLSGHMERKTEAAVAAVTFGPGPIAVAVLSCVIAVAAVAVMAGGSAGGGVFLLLVAAGMALYPILQYRGLDGRRATARQAGDQAKQQALASLHACVSELVDYRDRWTKNDAVAEEARDILIAVNPKEHTVSPIDQPRAVLA